MPVDHLAPLPMVQELQTLFGRAGPAGEIELKPAAERHWEPHAETPPLRRRAPNSP
jgi:hypothetical protein